MAVGSPGKVMKDLQTLYSSGRVGDLSDGAILERFVATRDEAAFEVLLARHGPMVLRVCRARLADPNAAADAFQAVFLILVQRAGAIRSRESIASWLHGVASRVSARARVDAARRLKHEQLAAERAPKTASIREEDPDITITALHGEIARLPNRYRETIVLCYLESHSCDEAARRLGRPVGTVKARLSRARGLLRERLLRRGVASSALVVVTGASADAAPPVPPELWKATLLSVTQASATPARVVSLAKGVLVSMCLLRISLIAICCLSAALGIGTVLVAQGALAPIDEPEKKTAIGVSTEKPPAPAVELPQYVTVRLALKQVLPDATASADPYLMTFALIRLAKAQNAMGDRAAALETFVLADQVAAKVPNEHLRRLAVMRTAVARGRIGDAAPARATLERFAREGQALGPEARYNLMSMVIDFLFQAGFKEEAHATLAKELAAVEAIKDEQSRDNGIHRLFYTQLTLRDYDGVLRQAARYTGKRSNMRASLLGIIMTYNRANDARPSKEIVQRALDLSREITYPYPKALAQQDIAAGLARAGDIEGALAVARVIGNDAPGPFEPGPTEIPRALAEIAQEQAKAGARDAAIGTLNEAFVVLEGMKQRDGLYADRCRTIAEAQAEVGDVAGAKGTVAAIQNDNVEKALALAALARGQGKAGDRAAAQATLRDALVLARAIQVRPNMIGDNPGENADRAVREIAIAQAETGDAKGALATVATRGSDAWKSETLEAIAPIQARLGDVPGALATARSIPVPTRAAEAYGAIASFQAKSGNAVAALSWASTLEPPAARAFALIGISEGLSPVR